MTNEMKTESNQTLKIQVEMKRNYGVVYYWPICKLSKQFTAFVEQKTLTLAQLRQIKAMGFDVQVHGETGPTI